MAVPAVDTTSTAPISVATTAGGQKIDQLQQWHPDNWFNQAMWSVARPDVTSPVADAAAYKRGYNMGQWRGVSNDLYDKALPAFQQALQHWKDGAAQLDKAIQVGQAMQVHADSGAGANRDKMSQGNADFVKGVQHRKAQVADVSPIGPAFEEAINGISSGHAQMEGLYKAWEAVLADAPKCQAVVNQTAPVISQMVRDSMKPGEAIMKAYQNMQELPQISPERQAQLDQQHQFAQQLDNPDSQTAATDQAATPGTTGQAPVPGTVVVPAGTSVAGHAVAGQAAAPSGTAITPSTPTLAGIGSSTLAPTLPLPAAAATAPVPSGGLTPFGPAASAAAGGAPGGPLGGTAGMMPFMPGAVGVRGVGGGVGGGAAAARGSTKRRDGNGSSDQEGTDHTGVPLAFMPPVGAGGVGRRSKTSIRPGIARRLDGSPKASGVTVGLGGRADHGGESTGEPIRRATSTRRRDDHDRDTVEFLDEEAWQADDPGVGVVSVSESKEPTVAPAPNIVPAAG